MAFIADIEAMLHHVHISEKKRSFVRYLRWEDVILEKLINYEMCVHVLVGYHPWMLGLHFTKNSSG